MSGSVPVTREQIVAYRRHVNGLEQRAPMSADALRRAAWAGLTDSMPRAALLSIHARVASVQPRTWEDPALVQVWGPRYSTYVVAARDVAPFTLGRLPDDGRGRTRAIGLADRLEAYLGGRRMGYDDAGVAMGIGPNSLRYAAATGRLLIRWEGARRPLVWTVAAPDVEPLEARADLARRFVHVLGPAAAAAFAKWAGIGPREAAAAWQGIAHELTTVATPIGERSVLTADIDELRTERAAATSVRFLPSGDAYFLNWGTDRELLVPDARHRAELWTSRVWPGALLVGPEVVGTWRRAESEVDVVAWRRLGSVERETVEAEAAALPLPDLKRPISVRWHALE